MERRKDSVDGSRLDATTIFVHILHMTKHFLVTFSNCMKMLLYIFDLLKINEPK